MSGYLDGDDAFGKLLDHHTETVTAMAKKEAARDEDYHKLRHANDELEKLRGDLTNLRRDHDALEQRAQRDEWIVLIYLSKTMTPVEHAALLERAEREKGEIPF